jgi:23S rRNA (cytosine1962-C5)-methyltransferase
MFEASQYELLDFGAGRKLERFGQLILDRPSPAATDHKPAKPKLWTGAAARFEISAARGDQKTPQRGRWIMPRPLPATWTIQHVPLKFELKLTNFGHVGIFPEQANNNWQWIAECVRRATKQNDRPPRVLNLFAYTGGSTLAAAAAGAEVTHVDSAKNIVAWARRNAELSKLSDAPIRWIVDDALTFARRELKRGKQYDAVILDPPSYGHGAKGETWKLDAHLADLLSVCGELTGPRLCFALLTCHTPDYDPQRLASCLVSAGFARTAKQIESGNLNLTTAPGRHLHAGIFARTAANA